MSIHRLIREGRQRLGMSEQQFADAVGVSRGAVQQWEKPGGTAPKRTNQPRVAELLGISVAELLSGGSNIGPGMDARAEVPLVSEVVAGNYTVIDNFKPKQPVRDRARHGARQAPHLRPARARRQHGERDRRLFPDGAMVIVEPEMEALPGDYVIALNASNQTTFKQLVKDGGEFYLKPLNSRYPSSRSAAPPSSAWCASSPSASDSDVRRGDFVVKSTD
jgi:SOS-response transcriptional repressor LexA